MPLPWSLIALNLCVAAIVIVHEMHHVCGATDLYSLACILYKLLSGAAQSGNDTVNLRMPGIRDNCDAHNAKDAAVSKQICHIKVAEALQ